MLVTCVCAHISGGSRGGGSGGMPPPPENCFDSRSSEMGSSAI